MQSKVFLPSISNGPSLPVIPTGGDLLPLEQLFSMLKSHPLQGRKNLQSNKTLSAVARAKCVDMATRDYVGHIDPDGYGANYRARELDYALPDWYSWDKDANNIESLAWGGSGDPVQIWDSWYDSTLGHKDHLLGLGDFYSQQVNVGMGYYYDPDSEYGHYWALLSAHTS